jgi:murein DD-endopeptidase MepM/ murein hydrolase activator NlpD
LSRGALQALMVLLLAFPSGWLSAQAAYKYRDSNGQWVFTDQAPVADARSESFNVEHGNDALHLSVDRHDDGGSMQLIAVNDCLCIVTFQVLIRQSGITAIPTGADYRATLEPGTRHIMVQADTGSSKPGLGFLWRAALGAPDAVHKPSRPYRVPFDVGSTFVISQAYPSRITHTTPESQYAVDIALPDGTPVYAAREGTVINARHDFFRGAADPVMLDQANVIEILHDDGTIGI